MNNKLKIAILGSGSIGKRHYNILKLNFQHELIFFRSNTIYRNDKSKNKIDKLYNWQNIIDFKPNIVIICSPTYLHIETSLKCANLGYKIFLEKPLGSSLNNLFKLLKIINKKKLTTYIGYNLRFHPIINKLKSLINNNKIIHMRVTCTSNLKTWRKIKSFKNNYSRYKLKGGGVILDLSHEIDYIEYLCGNITKIDGNFSKLSNITVDAEDYADLNIFTESGIVLLHINFFSFIEERTIKIDFKNFSISADLIKNRITNYSKINTKSLIYKQSINKDYTYINQFKYFFKNLNNFEIMNSLPKASYLFIKLIKFKTKYEK